jgi:ribose 5-phosphate isomerase B
MVIAIASDHAGYNLKEKVRDYLENNNIKYIDFGSHDTQSVEYYEYAHKVCESINKGESTAGILLCGTGIGMAMAANKHKNIRAACCSDIYSARMTRAHNDANVLTMGERVLGFGLAIDILEAFLETSFAGGYHIPRVEALNKLLGDIFRF